MPMSQVTLTTHNVVYQLLALIRGTVGSGTNPYPNKAGATRELIVQADSANGTGIVALTPYMSSPAVTGGVQLSQGDNLRLATGNSNNDVSLVDLYLVGSADGVKANLIWSDA